METLGESYWFALMQEENTETEDQEEAVETESPDPGGSVIGETADPDFQEVSEMILSNENTEEKEETQTETEKETESKETVDYLPYLENISIQIGVLDICLVLYLLIWIIKQFVRVPR